MDAELKHNKRGNITHTSEVLSHLGKHANNGFPVKANCQTVVICSSHGNALATSLLPSSLGKHQASAA